MKKNKNKEKHINKTLKKTILVGNLNYYHITDNVL